MNNRLYVGNLSFNTTRDALMQAFAACGEVTDVRVISDRETGQSRGFAFVTMATADAAAQATTTMNGALLDGRALRVNEAEERAQGGGGGGGSGGGGSSSRNDSGGGISVNGGGLDRQGGGKRTKRW